jgi:hypothetical protein
MFLAMTRTYDVLNCRKFLDKLTACRIRGLSKLWFESYLSIRIQFVEIINRNTQKAIQSNYSSTPRELHYGVPVLFVMYTNYLATYIKEGKIVFYTDDTNILVTDKNEEA